MGDLAKVFVSDVRPAVPSGIGVEAGLVVLQEQDSPHRRLRIIIGQPEARSILSAWSGSTVRRPSTWDLFISTVELLGGHVERAVITAVEERRHFYAAIEVRKNGEVQRIDCRASDAISLALRSTDAEILAEPSVLDDAGLEADADFN